MDKREHGWYVDFCQNGPVFRLRPALDEREADYLLESRPNDSVCPAFVSAGQCATRLDDHEGSASRFTTLFNEMLLVNLSVMVGFLIMMRGQ